MWAEYLIHKKSYVEVGSINRTIRAMLDRNGLEKCKVKAISLSNTNAIPAEILTKMPFRIEEKEFDSTEYYFQDYKIACASTPNRNHVTGIGQRCTLLHAE